MKRPRITIKAAVSLDGCLDDLGPERRVFSGPEDLQVVMQLRARSDAVLIGAGTLRSDNPGLLVRDEELRAQRRRLGKSADPTKVCLSLSGNIDPALDFFTTGECEKLVYLPEECCSTRAEEFPVDCTQIPLPSRNEKELLEFALSDLQRRGIRRLLVEGGSEILTQFYAFGFFDEFRLAVAPEFVAEAGAPRLISADVLERIGITADRLPAVELQKVSQLGGLAVLEYVKAR